MVVMESTYGAIYWNSRANQREVAVRTEVSLGFSVAFQEMIEDFVLQTMTTKTMERVARCRDQKQQES